MCVCCFVFCGLSLHTWYKQKIPWKDMNENMKEWNRSKNRFIGEEDVEYWQEWNKQISEASNLRNQNEVWLCIIQDNSTLDANIVCNEVVCTLLSLSSSEGGGSREKMHKNSDVYTSAKATELQLSEQGHTLYLPLAPCSPRSPSRTWETLAKPSRICAGEAIDDME